MFRTVVMGLLVFGASAALARKTEPASPDKAGKTRSDYLAADEVDWEYRPGGVNKMMRMKFGDGEVTPNQRRSTMYPVETVARITRRRVFEAIGSVLPAVIACPLIVYGQEKSGFPDGYDAVQAARESHRVIFENAFVRVLEVTVPPSGTTIPMHHHRWPSFFLSWDRGGKTPHVRYLRPDESVRDVPSVVESVHPGRWKVGWMKPEPMHSIQVVDKPDSVPDEPTDLRIEIKCRG